MSAMSVRFTAEQVVRVSVYTGNTVFARGVEEAEGDYYLYAYSPELGWLRLKYYELYGGTPGRRWIQGFDYSVREACGRPAEQLLLDDTYANCRRAFEVVGNRERDREEERKFQEDLLLQRDCR